MDLRAEEVAGTTDTAPSPTVTYEDVQSQPVSSEAPVDESPTTTDFLMGGEDRLTAEERARVLQVSADFEEELDLAPVASVYEPEDVAPPPKPIPIDEPPQPAPAPTLLQVLEAQIREYRQYRSKNLDEFLEPLRKEAEYKNRPERPKGSDAFWQKASDPFGVIETPQAAPKEKNHPLEEISVLDSLEITPEILLVFQKLYPSGPVAPFLRLLSHATITEEALLRHYQALYQLERMKQAVKEGPKKSIRIRFNGKIIEYVPSLFGLEEGGSVELVQVSEPNPEPTVSHVSPPIQ